MDEDQTRAFASGFDGYLEKPINVRRFPQQVRDFLDRGGRTVTAADEKTRVLVVDDQPANVRLLEATLTPRGYDVRGVESGEQALAALAEGGTDLVLLDIVMPGLDGYEVCRRIRADPATAFLPVVMVTASGDEQKIKALEAGADDFLTKPIDRSELLARVASLARIKRYQDTVTRQAGELAAWNRELEDRVQDAGRPARADGQAAPFPVAAAGRADRGLR